MIKLLRLLKGYVYFCAEGGFPERFINLCNLNGITLWNVKNDGVKVLAFTTNEEYKCLSESAENSGMTLKIIKEYGLKSFIYRHKRRVGALIGATVAVLFFAFMSGFIWEVEVVETDGVNVENFTESLAKYGVKAGARKSKIDVNEVQNRLMAEYPDIQWVSVNIFGGKAQAEISVITQKEEITDTNEPVNLVAKKNGTVTLVKGYRGVNEVSEMKTVVKGELLISGIIKNADGSEHLVHADGEVYAKTKTEITVSEKMEKECEITNESSNRYGIYVFGVKIPFGLKPKGDFLNENVFFLKSSEAELPLAVTRDDNMCIEKKQFTFSEKQSEFSALLDCVKEKRNEFSESKIKSAEYNIGKYGNEVKVTVTVDAVEDIAEEQKILVDGE